jgi:hypothetical protein
MSSSDLTSHYCKADLDGMLATHNLYVLLKKQYLPRWLLFSVNEEKKLGEDFDVLFKDGEFGLRLRGDSSGAQLAYAALIRLNATSKQYDQVSAFCYTAEQPILDLRELLQEINRVRSLTELCWECCTITWM